MTAHEVKKSNDPIIRIYEKSCPSLSKRSILTYEVGVRESEGTLHLRVIGNTGRGNWSKGWVCGRRIDGAVINQDCLNGKKFHELQEGKSRNTGGFILAALFNIGLVRKRGARFYEHIPGTNFKKVLEIRLREEKAR